MSMLKEMRIAYAHNFQFIIRFCRISVDSKKPQQFTQIGSQVIQRRSFY
jgi:hypothetical protein